MENIEFKGNCMGVGLIPRSIEDLHIKVVLLSEDDGYWYEDNSFSSYWIDELIQKLQEAKKFIETQEPDINTDGRQYGYKFTLI